MIDRLTLISILLFKSQFLFAQVNPAKTVSDSIDAPWAYAEEKAQLWAQNNSDTEPFGLESCDEESTSESAPRYSCTGIRTILVFGGEAFAVDFGCEFDFRIRADGKYDMTKEECG